MKENKKCCGRAPPGTAGISDPDAEALGRAGEPWGELWGFEGAAVVGRKGKNDMERGCGY